jgi:hypothetical protein
VTWLRRRRPGECTHVGPIHALTYARFYPNGWWCARHTPRAQRGLPEFPPPGLWRVVVDEDLLNSLGTGATNWWTVQAAQFYRSGKLRHLVALPIGGVTEIGPFPLGDAKFACDYLVENGLHPRTVKARRWTEQPHMPGCREAKPCRIYPPSKEA